MATQFDEMRAEYERTGNPLHVWLAIYLAAGDALPTWVHDYLFTVSEQLLKDPVRKKTRSQLRSRADVPQHVARALGFTKTGHGGAYQEFKSSHADTLVEDGETSVAGAARMLGMTSRGVRLVRAKRGS